MSTAREDGTSGPVIPAGSVLLAAGPASEEVLLVLRAVSLRFLGGFHAFPGGKVDAEDREAVGGDLLPAQRRAAARELFEETGVLLARRRDGSFPAAAEALTSWRRGLLAGERSFGDLLAAEGLTLDPADLTFAGSLVTPPFSPIRFDTAFFVATLPPGQAAEVWPGELEAGQWLSAGGALAAWAAGRLLLSPPTLLLLQTLAGQPVTRLPETARALFEERAHEPLPEILLAPGVQMIPLDAEGLPPTTHTNAYLVGTGPRYLIDPGPRRPDEQDKLLALLDAQRQAGRPLSAVVLTHHHRDHVGAARVCAERHGVPILAHAETARLLGADVPVTGLIGDRQELDLGPAPCGTGRWGMTALHTPGHAPGHLAFFEPALGLLLAGDMVSTMSSIIIAPPEGDLALYLESLRLLERLPARLLLPAHGGPSARPGFVLKQSLAHRRQREEELLGLLRRRPHTLAELAAEVYRGLPAGLLPLARLQLLAGLFKLQHERRAAPVPGLAETWQALPALSPSAS